jgi:hypothetical protein
MEMNGQLHALAALPSGKESRYQSKSRVQSLSRDNIFVAKLIILGFEVFTAVVMKSFMLCVITPCGPLKVNPHLGRTCRLHLQAPSTFYLLHAGFLLALFFDPEYGSVMLLWNVG